MSLRKMVDELAKKRNPPFMEKESSQKSANGYCSEYNQLYVVRSVRCR